MKTRKRENQRKRSAEVIRFEDLIPRQGVKGGKAKGVLFGTIDQPNRQAGDSNRNTNEGDER